MNISVDGQFFQGAHRMFNEDRIADEVRNHFGARFERVLKRYDFSVVWRECLDRDFMLWMLRRSPYGRSYYSELCDLVRSLDAERIASGLDPLDEVIACQKTLLEERYANERDRDERVSEELWEMVWDLADFWTREACIRAIGKSIFDGSYPDSESERVTYRISTHKSLMQEQARRLRELIANPFVPKASVRRTH
jgi:hypothetical protein